jgi:hypothetical protein
LKKHMAWSWDQKEAVGLQVEMITNMAGPKPASFSLA